MMKALSVSPDAGSEVRFQAYISALSEEIGHADRIDPLRRYCTGLLLPGERKSIEPMAARLDPRHVQATHQSLHHFVAKAPWDDAAVLTAVREQVLPALTRHGPITAWILDDTGFPKKGTHSVGVARQYCGQLGKQDNCQVAVSLSLANDGGSLPVAFDLYLPEEWIRSAAPRRGSRKPWLFGPSRRSRWSRSDVRWPAARCRAGRCRLWRRFRTALSAVSLSYVLGVQSTLGVWPPGSLPPKPGKGRQLQRRDAEPQPVSTKDLAVTLPPGAWQTVNWRAGSRGDLSGRFAALRVRPSHRDYCRAEPHPEEWLLIEWPEGDTEPSQYWLSTLPASTALVDLVHTAKLRWRIERDYQDLKQELGLDHYEGRGWRGFHHHATLCIAAYGFLVSERSLFPPQEHFRRSAPALPPGPRASRCGRNA